MEKDTIALIGIGICVIGIIFVLIRDYSNFRSGFRDGSHFDGHRELRAYLNHHDKVLSQNASFTTIMQAYGVLRQIWKLPKLNGDETLDEIHQTLMTKARAIYEN